MRFIKVKPIQSTVAYVAVEHIQCVIYNSHNECWFVHVGGTGDDATGLQVQELPEELWCLLDGVWS